jgi:magnesium-transporting ATPase (P-type)
MKLGWKLLLRTKDTIIIQEGYPMCADGEKKYHKFNLMYELPFTSSRQRMTIIVRDCETQDICLFSKGADSKMISLSCDADEMQTFASYGKFICSDRGINLDNSVYYTSDGMPDNTEIERGQMIHRIATFSKVYMNILV